MEHPTRLFYFLSLIVVSFCVSAQDVPQSISYTRIYDFIDELANAKIIDINTTVKPYSRQMIAEMLVEAKSKDTLLNRRMRRDLDFYLQNYALERDTLPNNTYVHKSDKNGQRWDVSLWQPQFVYHNEHFKFRVSPLIGGEVTANDNGAVIRRWWGADFQATIIDHISLYANLRDNSFSGELLKNGLQNPDGRLSVGQYFNLLPGAEYKEADYGGDYADMRGGVKFYCKWGSIGVVKENLTWGESMHSSNVLSGRGPSFPMLTLSLKPVKWLEFNYIHGWLVSNVLDKTRFYLQDRGAGVIDTMYRPQNKYIAANMLTFRPIKRLYISVGNSIIYAETTPHLAYFIPLAYYKALDHLQTKGLGAENQNSQLFATVSSRNIKNLHLYASVYVDEFKFARIKPSDKESNPISYQLGASYFEPYTNLYFNAEFTRSNIICYKHSMQALTYASNSYNLGHYLGDNSQEIYFKVGYRPIRKLDISLVCINGRHYNDYNYERKTVGTVISQGAYKDITWQSTSVELKALYEITNNVFVFGSVGYNNTRGYDRTSAGTVNTYENNLTAQQYLDKFTPKFYQGEHITFNGGLSVGL